jgi:PhoH-like ATPase
LVTDKPAPITVALAQKGDFQQIFLARPIVPLNNKDIGFLPGDAKEKVNPYMEPLWDNLKVIQNQYKENSKDYQRIKEMVQNEKLLVTPLAFIRGRSLSNIMFIVDEAQNVTQDQMETVLGRLGKKSKMVICGDLAQIDLKVKKETGFSFLTRVEEQVPGFKIFALKANHRHEIVSPILKVYQDFRD